MLEPLNVPAEMLSLAIMANQDLAGRIQPNATEQEKRQMLISITEMKHVPFSLQALAPQVTPFELMTASAIPGGNCYVCTFINLAQIFDGDAQATGGFIPPTDLTVSAGYQATGSANSVPLTGTVRWQSLLNCPILLVFPPMSHITIVFNWLSPPAVNTNRLSLRINGYLMPAGRQPVYQRFTTIFNS